MKLEQLVKIIEEQKTYFEKRLGWLTGKDGEAIIYWYNGKIDLCDSLLKIVELTK
jgi:hypothetical protein